MSTTDPVPNPTQLAIAIVLYARYEMALMAAGIRPGEGCWSSTDPSRPDRV